MLKTLESIGKLQKNYNITIPKKLREMFHIRLGDYVCFIVRDDGILIRPKKLIDSSQAYFWTKEWQKDELDAENDIKKGRTSKTKNAHELIKKLKSK